MSNAFEKAIAFVLPHETEFEPGHFGDYAHARTENVPGDGGGLTKFGIDQRSHPKVDIAALDKDGAVEIYKANYWDRHSLGLYPAPIAIALFDIFVNGGHPIEWLQRAMNDLDRLPSRLTEDGDPGPKTFAALELLTGEDIRAVWKSMLAQRAERFKRLAESPRMAKFLKGWLARNDDLGKMLATA